MRVSALAAEWIEIIRTNQMPVLCIVSALAAEWIEIHGVRVCLRHQHVSALAAEWIEIGTGYPHHCNALCLRPRGGVD